MHAAVVARIGETPCEIKIVKASRRAARNVDIAEVYNPKMVTKVAWTIGLTPGEAMELTNGWGFTSERHRGQL